MALAIGSDLPTVEVVYDRLQLVATTTKGANDQGPPNTLEALANVVVSPVKAVGRRLSRCSAGVDATGGSGAPGSDGPAGQLRVLKGISGRLRPGTATLVLSASGAGGSSLLRVVAGRQKPSAGSQLTINGKDQSQLAAEGVSMRRLAAFCSDQDENEALFTVYETLDFAYKSSIVPVDVDGKQEDDPRYFTPLTGDFMVKQLGLAESRDTLIGNALVRGISGGQKRRVSVGEALIQNARITCLDGPTNGLDAVTATEVCSFAVEVAHRTGGILLASLSAPLPETASLFDDVILLAEGRVLYHGPFRRMDDYLSLLGFPRPTYMDSAAWAVEIVSSPLNAALLLVEDCKKGQRDDGATGVEKPAPCAALLSKLYSLTVDALADAWEQSPWQKAMMAGLPPPVPNPDVPDPPPSPWVVPDPSVPMLSTAYSQLQYGQSSATGFWSQVALLTAREFRAMRRNYIYTGARIANAVFMSIIMGLVFLQLEVSEWFLFYSGSLFAVTFVSFLNNAIVPIALASRQVVYKQTSAGLYGEGAHNLAVLAAHLPISALADFLFATILYLIVGYSRDGGRWAFFCLIIFLMDLAISVLYRSFSYITPSQELAMIVSSLFTAVGLSTGGFFVVRDQVPNYLVWLLYISPFFWAVNSAANNEFSDPKYQVPYAQGSVGGQTQGQAFLAAFSFLDGVGWKWLGVGILLFYYLIFGLVVQPLLLKLVRYEISIGTKRLPLESSAEAEAAVKQALAEQSASSPSSLTTAAATNGAPPFTKVTLAFKDLNYHVSLKKPKGHRGPAPTKQLLRGVSGLARPGDLVALCGASGAGKTTLLDVLSFRKTTGTITGDIFLNGVRATAALFARASCFAEQSDAHVPSATVREALDFSVSLRADPANVSSASARKAVVDDVLQTLELSRIAERSVSTLSAGELKRLSLGVELCANTGLVFADEPTTGLSSRAATIVVRCLRRIASQGRTVICTIHQPTSALFFQFSHLCLLAPGGHQVFFGELGHHASSLVRYFESRPEGFVPRLPLHHNPSSWVLDILLMTPKKTQTSGTLKHHHQAEEEPSLAASSSSLAEEEDREIESSVAAAVAVTHHAAFPRVDAAPHPYPHHHHPAVVHHESDAATVTPPVDTAVQVRVVELPIAKQISVSSSSTTATAADAAAVAAVEEEEDGALSPTAAAPDHHALAVLKEAVAEATQHAELMTGADFAASFRSSELFAATMGELQQYLSPSSKVVPLSFSSSYARSYAVQVATVCARTLKDSWRNSSYTANRILAGAFLALFFGLLYSQLAMDTFQGVQSATGAVLAAMGFQGVLFFSIGVPFFLGLRPAIYRERDARFVDISAQALAMLLVETLWTAILTVIFVAIFYPLIGFKAGFSNYGFFALGAFICILSFVFAALAAAALFPSSIVAQLAGGVFLSVVFLFAGIFVPYANMPVGWLWMMQADFAFHLVRALALSEFFCSDPGNSSINGCQTVALPTPMGPYPMQAGGILTSNFDATFANRWTDIGIAAGILGGFFLATVALWKKVNWTRR